MGHRTRSEGAMNGQPHRPASWNGPVHAVTGPARNEHIVARFQGEFFPGPFEEETRAAAQNNHPFRRFGTKPPTGRRRGRPRRR